MGHKRPEQCHKGDFLADLDIVVERSSDNDDVTIFMWKNLKDEFRVEIYDGNKFTGIHRYAPGESKARSKYENSCEKYGCSPYPEAEEYFKRRGLLK